MLPGFKDDILSDDEDHEVMDAYGNDDDDEGGLYAMDAPLEIDLMLGALAPTNLDLLSLASNADVVKLLEKQQKAEYKQRPQFAPPPLESVVLSCFVTKINKRLKREERVLMLTDRALYNLEVEENRKAGQAKKKKKKSKKKKRRSVALRGEASGGGGEEEEVDEEPLVKVVSMHRRIDLLKVEGVTVSETGDKFIIHIPSEYDYFFDTGYRTVLLRTLARMHKLVHGDGTELSVQVVKLEEIASFVGTKDMRQRQKKVEESIESPAKGAASGGRRQTFVIMNKIRGLVSKKKVRYQKDGFDLDLTYITERVLAMGYPSEQIEGLYRNPYSEVYRFLQMKHKDHYKVYNLCSERSYDPGKFNYRVARFPFDDHNCPPFELILEFCEDVAHFLSASPENVVAVHCKAGKGRTGLLVSCYLLYSGRFTKSTDALDFFGEVRTMNGKGVTIPSQQRYVHYFGKFLRSYFSPKRPLLFPGKAVCASSIKLFTVPHIARDGGSAPYFSVFRIDKVKIYDSRLVHAPKKYNSNVATITIPCSLVFSRDVLFQFYHDRDKIFHFWLNSNFCPDSGVLELGKFELDKPHKDKHHKKFEEGFKIAITFEPDERLLAKAAAEQSVAAAAAAAESAPAAPATAVGPLGDGDPLDPVTAAMDVHRKFVLLQKKVRDQAEEINRLRAHAGHV